MCGWMDECVNGWMNSRRVDGRIQRLMKKQMKTLRKTVCSTWKACRLRMLMPGN